MKRLLKYSYNFKYCFLIVIVNLIICENYCQKKAELRNLQLKAKEELEYTNKILEETRERKIASLDELNILEYRIVIRRNNIQRLNREIVNIEKNIEANKDLITSLENDLERVKNDYAKIILNTYKKREKNILLMFLLASESFNQAYKRIKYVQNYSNYKRQQAKLIAAFKKIIDQKIKKLNEDRAEKKKLLKEKAIERSNILRERSEKELLVKELKKREEELLMEIEEKKKTAEKIKKELERFIESERRGKGSLYSRLTPEEILISDDFERNRGKLPWPTKYGIVTGKYGKHAHPVLPNIMQINDGIDISTVRNAQVRAIFNGEVSRVFSIPGENYTVIIKHGNFFSLYHNLINIKVASGDIVNTKEIIGSVFTDERTNQTILHFQIWKELNKNDPVMWLSN